MNPKLQQRLLELNKQNPSLLESYYFLEDVKYYLLNDGANGRNLAASMLTVWRSFKEMHDSGDSFTIESLIAFAHEQSKPIYELLQEVRQDIKDHTEVVYHISAVAPNEYKEGKISPSDNLNAHQTERGEWVFASSIVPEDNPYLARPGTPGMVLVDENVYIYGQDSFVVEKEHIRLSKPAYIYEISSEKFTPVVRIRTIKDVPTIDFSLQEWVSDEPVDMKREVRDIRSYDEITALLKTVHVYAALEKDIGKEMLQVSDIQERRKAITNAVQEGRLRDVNAEFKQLNMRVEKDTIREETSEYRSKK